MSRSLSTAAALGAVVVAHVEQSGVVDGHLLGTDPIQALLADPSVVVELVETDRLPAGCSIAACYDRHATPARLLIARDASPGRRSFSALHEYCHHLRDQVDAVVDALWDEPDGGVALEERICDAFAAAVLAPQIRVAALLPDGVTARAVVGLFSALSASREACAVAAAQQLVAPGYVMLLDHEGWAVFTARSRDARPVARRTPQRADIIKRILHGGHASGIGRVTFADGVEGPEWLVDAVNATPFNIAVWTEHSPAWATLTVGRSGSLSGHDGYCELCGDFVSFTTPCRSCDEPRCPTCGSCGCAAGPVVAASRACARCGLTLPPAAFANASANRCTDCS